MERVKQIFILIMIAVSLPGFSQSFKGGFTAGLNASQIDNDNDNGFGKLGLNASAFVGNDFIEDLLGWQLEVKYSARGKSHMPTLTENYIEIIDLKYIEFPFSVNYYYKEKFQIEIGLSADVLLSERYENEDDSNLDVSYANELNRFGINVFGGINYFFSPKLSVGLRYTYSGVPFYKFDFYTPRYRNSGWFHDVLSIGMKYYFVG